MHRCFLEPAGWDGPLATLSQQESRHLCQVLRARVGEAVEVFDGEGRSAEAAVVEAHAKRAMVRLGVARQEPAPRCAVTLYQGWPKPHKVDFLIQKAVELGVARVALVSTEHAVVRLSSEAAGAKEERWRVIAVNAAKQCGRNRLPELAAWASVAEAIAHRPVGERWVCGALDPSARPFRAVWEDPGLRTADTVGCWIGPEGDFSAAEYRALRAAGALFVTMGPHVLRTETAAFMAMCIALYETQETAPRREGQALS